MRNALNPLNELSDIYLGSINEEDNSPEAIKARVMQHVRAIRYRARKEGENLNKAYNEFMGSQSGISSTEKQMVKERLGLTGGAAHVGEEVVRGTSTNAAGEKIPWKVSTKGGKSTVTDKFGTREMRKASDTVNKNRMRKEELEGEISPEVEKLIESGLFSDAEIAKIADIQEADIADIIARLEKKRISKGGDPEESPLPAMRKYHADKKKKAAKKK